MNNVATNSDYLKRVEPLQRQHMALVNKWQELVGICDGLKMKMKRCEAEMARIPLSQFEVRDTP